MNLVLSLKKYKELDFVFSLLDQEQHNQKNQVVFKSENGHAEIHTFSECFYERGLPFQMERCTEEMSSTSLCVCVQILTLSTCSHCYYTKTHTSLPSYPEKKGLHCLSLRSFPFKHTEASLPVSCLHAFITLEAGHQQVLTDVVELQANKDICHPIASTHIAQCTQSKRALSLYLTLGSPCLAISSQDSS